MISDDGSRVRGKSRRSPGYIFGYSATLEESHVTIFRGIILMLGAILALAFSARDGVAATVEGRILDAESGEPMGYAAVKVDGAVRRQGVLSGVDGSYVIGALRQGRYTLSVSFVGYEDAERPFVIVDNGAAIRIDVRLRPEPIEVAGITVEASRLGDDLEALTGVINVDRQQLSSVPGVAEADPIRALPSCRACRPRRTSERTIRARRRTRPDAHPSRPGPDLQPDPRVRILLHRREMSHESAWTRAGRRRNGGARVRRRVVDGQGESDRCRTD